MSGRIEFATVEQMAEFLKAFTGSTATFKAWVDADGKGVIDFSGGF